MEPVKNRFAPRRNAFKGLIEVGVPKILIIPDSIGIAVYAIIETYVIHKVIALREVHAVDGLQE